MYAHRAEHTSCVEEVLERILERGVVLDGNSHLAALAPKSGITARASSDGARIAPVCPSPQVTPSHSRNHD